MKKYLFGLAAIVFALGVVAFKTAEVKRAAVVFNYTAPGGSFSEANVEANANWSVTTITCPLGTVKACKFTVDDTYTKLVSGVRVLRTAADGAPFITIVAENPGGGVNFRVSNLTANISAITHKAL